MTEAATERARVRLTLVRRLEGVLGRVRGARTLRLARLALLPALLPACAPPPRMCFTEGDCGRAACVAGRCLASGATAAVLSSRRLLLDPVEIGWVRRGSGGSGNPATDVAVLGREDAARLFLRFDVPLPREATLVEGFLLLERAPGLDADTEPLALHVESVEGRWDARSLSWAQQPAVVGVGAARTTVVPAVAGIVRLDIRPLLERWRRRGREGDPASGGLAVVAEPAGPSGSASPSGLPVALVPLDVPPDQGDPVLQPEARPSTQPPSAFEPRAPLQAGPGDPRRQVQGPRLELYVR